MGAAKKRNCRETALVKKKSIYTETAYAYL